MAYRAGLWLMDLEFVQFHPTVLYHPQKQVFSDFRSGEGRRTVLLNEKGERFMQGCHPMAELAQGTWYQGRFSRRLGKPVQPMYTWIFPTRNRSMFNTVSLQSIKPACNME